MQNLVKFTPTGMRIRIISLYGQPWFHKDDLCRALGPESRWDAVELEDGDIHLMAYETNEGSEEALFVSEGTFYDALFKGEGPRCAKCVYILTHALSDSFRAVETEKGLAPGTIIVDALENCAQGDPHSNYLPKSRPNLRVVEKSKPDANTDLFDPKTYEMFGVKTTREQARTSRFLEAMANIGEAMIAGIDIRPNMLLGRIASALACEFRLVKLADDRSAG